MKLRRIHVANWGCIGSLRLDDLPDGIVVLHGPNGIGKSSLVQALRSCLFDHDHSSWDSVIKGAYNWQSRATPKVTVEFEQAGRHYRIAKAFSKLKEGAATLDEQNAGTWRNTVSGKEANVQARALLGVDRSNVGLFQLLWLEQGEVRLPNKVDGQLQQQIESILGTMITGRDIEFKEKLDKACDRWFTAKTRAEKKDSPRNELAEKLAAARVEQEKVEGQFRDVETALGAYKTANERQPELARELLNAEQELDEARKTQEALRERRHQHDLALGERRRAQDALAAARKHLEVLQDLKRKEQSGQAQLVELEAQRQTAEQRRDLAQRDVEQAEQVWQNAQQSLKQHQDGQAEIDDWQQLVTLLQQQQALKQTLQKHGELAAEQQRLEGRLSGPPAPTEAEIDQLRTNRRAVEKLRHLLEAESLRLTLHAERPLEVDANLDDRAEPRESVDALVTRIWMIRQHGSIVLPGIATLTIARGTAKQDLDEAAHSVARLEQDFHTATTVARVDPTDPRVVDLLAERRHQHAAWLKDLKKIRQELQGLAPEGDQALTRDLASKQLTLESVQARQPSWPSWTLTHEAVTQRREAFRREALVLQQAVAEADKARQQTGGKSKIADKEWHECNNRATAQTAALDSLRRQMEQQGSEEVLVVAVQEAATEADAAERTVQATALTAAEQQIDERVRAAQEAVAKRRERRDENDRTLAHLRGRLADTEGLHQKRIQAEQHVNELTAALARESLRADAHSHLRNVFEDIRGKQVQRTVGPVSERVLQWARRLGIDNYRELDFGAQVLPSKLKLQTAGADAELVDMASESYGRLEQLSLLIRLALGGLLARDEPAVAVFDDPLAHADAGRQRRFLEVLQQAAAGAPDAQPPAGALQIIILTCHPERFDYLPEARHIDLQQCLDAKSG